MATREKRLRGREESEAVPTSAWFYGIVAWLLPGIGHILLGRWRRGLILGCTVWAMFVTGLLFGGHLFSLFGGDANTNPILQIAPAIANIGTGGIYIFCWLTGLNFAELPEAMRRPTFEYGNTFLLVAGLLNYLAMLDAFDIAAGRKS